MVAGGRKPQPIGWLLSILQLLVAWTAMGQPAPAAPTPPAEDPLEEHLHSLGDQNTDLALQATDPDPLVRAGLCRLLIRHPGLAQPGWLERLALDEDHRVALLALLALAPSSSPEAMAALQAALLSPVEARREIAAISLLLREAIAGELGLPPVPDTLIQRCHVHIVTPIGRQWLHAIEHYQAIRQQEARWAELMVQIGRLADQPASRDCVDRVRRNPGLLLPSGDCAAERYPIEPPRFPDLVILEPESSQPIDLLLEGSHDRLADLRFLYERRFARLERLVSSLFAACSADLQGSIEPPESAPSERAIAISWPAGTADAMEPGRTKALWNGWIALDLSITNHPYAYRHGVGDFVLGEDIEYTLFPLLRLAYRNAAQLPPSGLLWPAERGLIDGHGVEIELNGLLSSRFFPDRSRPGGEVRFFMDSSPPSGNARATGHRLLLAAELLPGGAESARDVGREPLPHVAGTVDYTLYRSSGRGARDHPGLLLSGQLSLIHYLLDDPTSPPRQRRWIEPILSGRWMVFDLNPQIELGIEGQMALRTTAEMDGLAALSSNWSACLVWTRRELMATAWSGLGMGWDHPGKGEVVATPIVGVSFQHDHPFGPLFRLDHQVTFQRSVRNLGRLASVGTVDRAEAALGFSFAQEMRDNIWIRLFFERTSGPEEAERLEWGGLELYIPIALEVLDQQLAYTMRYLSLVDTRRLGERPQQVFEAVLQAGMRF
ncbi:MAG: hypothetical protein JW797_12020 [Bradymonadales bacterium]|nr:hypothetical protein [Bradymonadales bacterium]